jgi:hypothetical protein
MSKYLLSAAFVVIASLAVYGATVAPAAVAFDGYDHSFETASGDSDVEPGY